MEIILLIFAIVFLAIGLYYISDITNEIRYFKGGFFLTVSICLIFLFGVSFHNSAPSAIDVYRGKTTLEITYRDGSPVDSIVVFKTK